MRGLADIENRDKNSFGLVRLVAAILVVVSHSFLLTGGTLTSEPLATSTSFPLGAHAVHVFFALSGFLIAARWHARPDLSHFLAGRMLRILPALVLVTLATLLVAALVVSRPADPFYLLSPEAIIFFIRTVFLLDGGGSLGSVIPQTEVSGSILATVWTLRFEVFCYLSLPILMHVMSARQRGGLVVTALIVSLSGAWLILRDPHYLDASFIDNLARFFFTFYLGVLAWFLRAQVVLSIIGVATLGIATWFAFDTQFAQVLEIALVAYTTFWIGSMQFGWLSKFTNTEDLSYGIYLMGYPIQQAVLVLLPPHHVLTNISISLLIAMPLAFVSWRIIEKPSLLFRSKTRRLVLQMFELPLAKMMTAFQAR